MPPTATKRCIPAFFLALGFAAGADAAEEGFYVRGAIGYQWSGDARFSDQDCAATRPPALFGCVDGDNGLPIGARGDFGGSTGGDVGLGYRLSPRLRLEARYSRYAGFDYSGHSNFISVPGDEPVSAGLQAQTLMAHAFVELLPRDFGLESSRWRPYAGLGLGWARNRLEAMDYRFPGLSANAATITPGGREDNFAWQVDLGLGYELTPRLTLDFAWSWADLGTAVTDPGTATVVRRSGTRPLSIAGTEAPLRVQGLRLGLRYAF